MDKALKKINELKQKLEELDDEKYFIEHKRNCKENEINPIYIENEGLRLEKIRLEQIKNKIQYNLSNIKKWKRNTIIKTTLLSLVCLVLTIITSLGTGENVITMIFILGVGIPGAILCGESNDYYSARKYLKTHKLEEIEKEIEENQKNYSLNNEKINMIESELTKINIELNKVVSEINLAEEEIKQLNTLRASIINRYLNNNQEFDNLINTKYKIYKLKKLERKG